MRKYWMTALAVALGALLGGALLTTPASATTTQDGTELPSADDASEYLSVTVAVTGNCTATITYTNSIPDEFSGSWAYWGDYRVGDEAGQPDSAFPDLPVDSDGELVVDEYQNGHNHGVDPEQLITSGPLAGEKFGLQYNPVLIHRGETVPVDVVVTAPTTLAAWIKRGPDQPWYVGEVEVEVPCEQADDDDVEPTPSPSPTVTESPTPSASPTPGETPSPTASPSEVEGEDGEQLPVTGASLPYVVGAGAALLGLGTGVVLLTRKRKQHFINE